MKTYTIKKFHSIFVLASVALLTACAQSDETPATVTAPSNLAYDAKVLTFAKDVAVNKAPTVTGTVASCTASPALPTGLSLSTSCALTGTPTATQAATAYTVTASNDAGSVSASIKIAVVDYTAAMQGTPTHSVGKTLFQIKITDKNGTGQVGLSPQIVPEMDMGSMVHTTPVASVTDDGGGLYTAEVYYLMASMASMPWTVKVLDGANNEIATRIPVTVGGASTARVSVSNASDQFNNMGTATNRPYFVFIDTVTGTAGNHTIKIFAATRKSMMMHPALVTGLTLADASNANWNVTSIGIELSIDSGATWITSPTNDGGGKFSFTGVAGLSTAASQDLVFKVVVNGNTIGQGTLKAQIP
ncbi:MAG: hypothetical protein LDLANPLL_02129 [Turneriella sp.]|nr:hypothetical protein [Turneriella sp.]